MSDFAHRLQLDRIRDGERIELVADDKEREAIRDRLDLAGLERLEANATLSRDGDAIRATGRMLAALEQNCVVTGEPISAMIDEPFEIAFVPEPSVAKPDDEIELGADEVDTVFHDGATIDLGLSIADTLALSLDPYPRSAGAEAALKEAGVMTEEEASPFAVLAKLKRDDGA
ncbi:MAG TPA: DUF177 domain-containing protein [Sphingomicrobium sp.]|nr:DUF177 domain-containing protein [Sphingomicrobium sp.]